MDNSISFREPPTTSKSTLLAEFPPIELIAPKRTKSWSNLTASMSALKLDEVSGDSLQMKLNLKKQIWTGAWNESTVDRTRPLSWGHTAIKSTSQYVEVREYDSEQLLIACSKKLAAWQENGPGKHKQQQQQQGKSHKNKYSTGMMNERRLNRDGGGGRGRLQKGFHVSTASFINRCNITRITELGKAKKLPQNYALAKIVEATDFITGLNRGGGGGKLTLNSGNGGGTPAAPRKKNSLTSTQLPPTATNPLTFPRNHLKKKTKFKTGGIVVTAVQSHQGGTAPKRIRPTLPGRSLETTQEPVVPARDTAHIKNLVKKVKNKIRKKPKP